MKKELCNIGEREPKSVNLECRRCGWKGTAGDEGVRTAKAPGGEVFALCPRCDGFCHEREESNAG